MTVTVTERQGEAERDVGHRLAVPQHRVGLLQGEARRQPGVGLVSAVERIRSRGTGRDSRLKIVIPKRTDG